jgi:hypothetical protein
VILRRSFGHSLFLLPLWIAGLTWIFKRKYEDFETRDLVVIIALNCLGHLFFDLINSFGVQLFWPFSLARPELAITFIIDLSLVAFLALPHLSRLKASWRPRLTDLCRASLAAVAIYLAMAFSARQYALALLANETGGKGFQYAFPEPLGAYRWRGVVKDGEFWRVYLVDTHAKTVTQHLILPDDANTPAALAARESPFGRRVGTFFKAPVWTTAPKPEGGWSAMVFDLRFTSLVFPRAPSFEFEFDVPAKADFGQASATPRRVRIW